MKKNLYVITISVDGKVETVPLVTPNLHKAQLHFVNHVIRVGGHQHRDGLLEDLADGTLEDNITVTVRRPAPDSEVIVQLTPSVIELQVDVS